MVRHIDQDGVINDDACSYSFPVTLAANSPAPTRNTISLSWPVISGADSLTLERAKDNAFTIEKTTLTAPAASATTASSTGLTSSTTYYYRMKVTMGGDDSNWSNTASATTSAFTFPVTLAANSPVPTRNTISLSWPVVTGADSLTLQRATNNTFTTGLTTLTAPAASATTASSTGLASTTTYYYRMSVTMGGETSNWSNTASNTTLDFPAPTGLAMTSKTASSINLSWNSVAGAVNYTLRRSGTADFASYVDATIASGTLAYTSSSLTAGTYYYKINVIDAGGTSGWSTPITTATQLIASYTTPGSYTWTVPANIISVQLEAWGAKGGNGGSRTSYGCNADESECWDYNVLDGGVGGNGGYAKGILSVTGGQTINIIVGAGGSDGGNAYDGSNFNCSNGTSGGESNIVINSVYIVRGYGGSGGTGAVKTPRAAGVAGAIGIGWYNSGLGTLSAPATSNGVQNGSGSVMITY